MEDWTGIIVLIVIVIISSIGGAMKKSAERKARERLDSGDKPDSPPPAAPNQWSNYGWQQYPQEPKQAIRREPAISYPAPPVQQPPPRRAQAQYDEEEIAAEIAKRYLQAATPEISLENTQPSYDEMFSSDKTASPQPLSDAISRSEKHVPLTSLGKFEAGVLPSEALSRKPGTPDIDAPRKIEAPRRLLGVLNKNALKRAIVLREVLGPPKGLED